MTQQTTTSRLCEHFTRHIRSGEWGVDRPIPPERDLMRHYKVSRSTIRAALRQLEIKGWLEARQGSGRRVRPEARAACGMIGFLTCGGEFRGGQGQRFRKAAEAAAEELGHELVTFTINTERGRVIPEDRQTDVELDMVCAALVYAWEYESEDIARLAKQMPVAAVMTHDATASGVPSFMVDYAYEAAFAVCELAKIGHKRIALMGPPSPGHCQFWRDIRRGFDLGVRLSKLDPKQTQVIQWSHQSDSQVALYEQVLGDPDGPTALISQQDRPILALLREGERRDIDIHRHLATTCLVDLNNRRGLASEITHFAAPIERVARNAVTYLHQAMEGQKAEELMYAYYGEFQPRKSLVPADQLEPHPTSTASASASTSAPR